MSPKNSLTDFGHRLRNCIHDFSEDAAPARDRFDDLALELFALQYESNAPYRKFCQAKQALAAQLSDWREIPAMPVSAFKELDVSCLELENRPTVFHSSGTTTHTPSRHFHSDESLAIYEQSLLAWFDRCVQPDLSEMKMAILTPPASQAKHSSLVHMFETIRLGYPWKTARYFGDVDDEGAWTQDAAGLAAFLETASKAGAQVFLFGTAFSFVHLLDYLAEHNLQMRLAPGSRVLETGGYKGRSRVLSKSELHVLVTARLGIPLSHIVSEYGMSELSSQAYAASDGVFRFPLWARVMIVSPETGREVGKGETGIIRIFDLANVYSVMAIQTEDLAVRRDAGFELLGRAVEAEARGCSLMSV